MNRTREMAPFEVRGTRYGRTMATLNTLRFALLGGAIVGELPALLIANVLPDPWKPLAWAWVLAAVWLVARWMRRRTRVWSVVSPDGIVAHCHGRETHVAWSDIRRFDVASVWAVRVYIVVETHDRDRIQIAATAGTSAEVIERLIAYGHRATDGAWTPEPDAPPGNA